ncbi:MAG: peptidylprolyl isomerase [Candidatus Beckwithbacteria bacterium]
MNNTKILIVLLAAIAVGLFLIKQITNNSQTSIPTASLKIYSATLQTDLGDIVIRLNTKDTPITAKNFISLAEKGFYDQTIFHRIINGFMIQGGDPQGDGTGGPGYKFDDEPFSGDYIRGAVAMANSGPNTNGSQFFIMHQANPLPKNYVIFGQVIAGLDTVDKIATAAVTANSTGEKSKPITPIIVKTVTISSQDML